MISHKHKCIFIHIPKAAGTSVERFLRGIDPEIPERTPRRRGFSRFLNDHPHYYIFSFVRNPYDRFVSVWKWGELHVQKYNGIPYFNKKRSVPFDEYVHLVCNASYRQSNLGELWSKYDAYHTVPQYRFFPHLNNYKYFGDDIYSEFTCDFIGRFENLNKDFNKACSDIGVKQLKLPHAYNSKTFEQPFQWTKELKERVYNYYKKDFDLFYPNIQK